MFWELYGDIIVDAIIGLITTGLTAIAGYVALRIKTHLDAKDKDNQLKQIIKTSVRAVEQMYKDLHGEEKLNMAIAGASEMLAEKGIEISEFELKWLIESAVGEFNNVFNSTFKDSDNGAA